MQTYEIVTSTRTVLYLFVYSIIAFILVGVGKVETILIAEFIPGKIFDWMNTGFIWIALGLINLTFWYEFVKKKAYREVSGATWDVYTNDFFNKSHWVAYPQGKHLGSVFETKFKSLKLFKSDETRLNQKVSTIDDDVLVSFFITVEPTTPVFLLLNAENPQQTALKFALAKAEQLNQTFGAFCKSDDMLKFGKEMTEFVQSYLNIDPTISEIGLRISVTIKDVDYSNDVSKARSQQKITQSFREAVDELAGKREFTRHPDTNELLYDVEGKPIMVEPDITREEAAAMIQNKFSHARDEKVIKIIGDPEVLKSLRYSGIMAGTAGEGHTL